MGQTYNELSIDPIREAMARMLASDGAEIVKVFLNNDSTGDRSWSKILQATLVPPPGVNSPESRAQDARIRDHISQTLVQAPNPLLEAEDALAESDSPSRGEDNRIARMAHTFGYLMGGIEVALELGFDHDADQIIRARGELLKSVFDTAAAVWPGTE